MNKYAFIVTANQRYLYGVNATINAQEVAGTKANFEIVNGSIEPGYLTMAPNVFDFDVIFTDKGKYPQSDYFTAKYFRALELQDKYDAVCIIDGDLFMYTNVDEYFRLAAEEGKFITALNARWRREFPFGDPDVGIVWDKPDWIYADFPTFFNPKLYAKFVEDWIAFGDKEKIPPHCSRLACSPCGSMNRSICKHVKKEDVIGLNGYLWVADFQVSKHEVVQHEDKLVYKNGPFENEQIMAVHNRWWQPGRGDADLKGAAQDTILERSMNNIRDFMEPFAKRKLFEHLTYYRTDRIKAKELI
jgi:hypothetical protein